MDLMERSHPTRIFPYIVEVFNDGAAIARIPIMDMGDAQRAIIHYLSRGLHVVEVNTTITITKR